MISSNVRGADVSWLSQYPHEREVLFPPLTGVECISTRCEGSTLVLQCRLATNQMSLTLEQVKYQGLRIK